MKKIMNLMVNSCNKTTELIDKQQITSLTTKEKLQLQIHKSMCNTCNAYEQQSKLIENVVANWFSAKSQTTVRLDDEKKKKIIEEINRS
jgi:hypothetical protein